MYETVIYEKTYIAVLFLYFLGNTHFCYNALEREGEKYGKILIYKGNDRKIHRWMSDKDEYVFK